MSVEVIEKNNSLEELNFFLEEFLNEHDVADLTRKNYRKRLKVFELWVGRNSSGQPTRSTILEYKKYLQEQGLSSYTVSSYLTAVRQFFSWLEAGLLYPNIAKTVKGPKKPKGFRRDALSESEVIRLLQSLPRGSAKERRDFAIINLLVRRGLRTIEVTRANVCDLRKIGNQPVLFLKGKGSSESDEFIVLGPRTLDPIREHLQSRHSLEPTSPLFESTSNGCRQERLSTRSIRKIVRTAFLRAGLNSPRLSAHSLRHTAVTLALQGGASIQETQRMARHSDINSTLIYAHNIDRVRGLPELAVDKLLDKGIGR